MTKPLEQSRETRNDCSMKFILAFIISTSLFVPAYAQETPSSQTTDLVGGVTEAFFDQLVKDDFAIERAFMTDQFANSMSVSRWSHLRAQVTEITGATPRYVAHGLRYFQNKKLFADVDFSGQTSDPNTLICGYVLWEIPTANTIGLTRFEQNIVSVEEFRNMPQQEAAQLMTNWRCPAGMIETTLGISVNQ